MAAKRELIAQNVAHRRAPMPHNGSPNISPSGIDGLVTALQPVVLSQLSLVKLRPRGLIA